ncbi:hypothetical protein BBJ28_00015652 [Nothophytophthora sp. Chile5]|nr:hypothetical protein BBJ28_00015652 [Nothophytophthora sp. Chile5]
MGWSDHMSENVTDNGQQCWSSAARSPPMMATSQWEPDHEPPLDDKPDCRVVDSRGDQQPTCLPSLQQPMAGKPNPLAPLNHHNQITRFLTKQTLGYVPKLSVRSPERTVTSSPRGVFSGSFSFSESPRGSVSAGSSPYRLPSLSSTPPLSPQKWSASSSFAQHDEQQALGGRPSIAPFAQSSGIFPQRGGSFSESCSSPIPPLKQARQGDAAPTTMSIADLCQPFRYMRSHSCPSDSMPTGDASNSSTPPEVQEGTSPQFSWKPALERQEYVRTQSCHSEADALYMPGKREVDVPLLREFGPFTDEVQRGRLQRSSSLDAPRALALINHKRSAAEFIGLHQWLDRPSPPPSRSSLGSLADSADSMRQLERAGRSMRISDSPRSDDDAQQELKREKKLCAFPQCTSNAVTRGLCISHGGGRRCQRKGCTRGAQSKGLCVAHGGGRICRSAGCSNIQRSMGLCIRHGGGRRCSVEGCQKGVVRQDLCTAHGGKRKCRVPECTKHVKKKGLCRSHANSMSASGSS